MRVRLIPKTRYLLLFVVLSFTWSVRARAEAIRLVQVTDPHLFDGGQEGAENQAALGQCIKRLNERVDEHADYVFAIVTGDIGIENLISHVNEDTGERVLDDPNTRERQLDNGAAQLASILAPTKIPIWLFLPGNNDLFKEEPNSQYYKLFIDKLRERLPGLKIIDLCPELSSENKYEVGGFAFIGFNDASFKNNNDPKRIAVNKQKQLKYIQQVIDRLGSDDVRKAFIFYHIPETDDPHIVLNFDTSTPDARKEYADNPYRNSSWFVDKEIHDEWQSKVVNNPKVLGLFAGHYHDWRRETYLDYHWMVTANYSSGSLSKLFICPPLAIKRQDKTPLQARGFQEVAIDAMGRIKREVFWFNPTDRTFDTDPSSQNNQLALALFYERTHDWSQAENYFGEAAKNAQSTSVRNQALAGLVRVKDAQHPWVKTGLAWTDPLFLAPYVLRPVAVVAIALVLGIIFMAIREGLHAMVIHPFDGDDELAELLAVGFPALRAKVSKALSVPNQIFLPQDVQTIFPFVAPRLNQLLPEQAFEIAGVKIPDLNVVLRWLVRPRFEVRGGSLPSLYGTFVYAEVWRRRRTWFGLRLATVVTREIPVGSRRGVEVENFIYDVYLRANAAI